MVHPRRAEFQTRLRIETANFADHVGDVLVIDTAEFSQGRDIALRQEIEMLDQCLHRRVVTIELAQLDREALAQGSRAHAGRVELLQHRKNRLDIRRRCSEPLGGLAQIRRQVTRLIHQIDQVLADHALRGGCESHRQLFGEMTAERDFGGDEGFQIVAVIVGGAAAPFGIGRWCRILCGARGGLSRLLGEHIVEAGVEGLLDLGAAAEVAVHPFFLGRFEIFTGGTVGEFGALNDRIVAVGGT